MMRGDLFTFQLFAKLLELLKVYPGVDPYSLEHMNSNPETLGLDYDDQW